MIDLELQNPCDFDEIPTLDDLQTWSDSAYQKTAESEQSLSLVIRIVDEEEGIHLNDTYRQKNYATNVLSFPYEAPEFSVDIPELNEPHLGDLVLCEKVVLNEAKEQNKTAVQHWAHLVVHGVLHLQGYDHINDADAEVMESLEIDILKTLGFANPYGT